ncbi:hypothetical protein CE91St41_25290 [Oscillospiraceae bacterium]|nr:hypothetical protein CE91St40_12250 [Oscillospiraceae bacterium]BDF75640.1 hypothetical protein CE91St41_25290 [Oscillospiraceae bacterium]
MAEQNGRTEITSADKQQLGFEYQYLYFIVRLLQLLPGEEVGYEALDDVHVITATQKDTLYIQVKHTIGKAANDTQPNLAKLSEDLWKTLSNWSKLISDPSEARNKKETQKLFVSQSRFILVVNRKFKTNEVICKIQQLKDGLITGTEMYAYLKKLSQETKDKDIKVLINNVTHLSVSVLSAFLKRTEFHNSTDSLFDQIRDGIRSKMTEDEYVNDVFSTLYLQLKEDFFNNVQNGRHQVITFSKWMTHYRAAFNIYRTTLLPFRQYSPLLPEHLEQQTFVSELIEIGAIDITDNGLAEIAELTEYYLSVELQLDDWYQDGRISLPVLNSFHKEAALTWKRIHQFCHRSTKSNSKLDYENALACFDEVMKEKLKLISTDMGLSLSNGEFIKLANESKIGWKHSWASGSKRHGD